MVEENEAFVIHDLGNEDNKPTNEDSNILSSSDIDVLTSSEASKDIEDSVIADIKEKEAADKPETASKPEKAPKSFLINKYKKAKVPADDEQMNRRSPDNITSARAVVIDFLEGTTKKSEAMDYARGFIDNHYSSPQSCFIFVIPYEGIYAVEIHDGGDGKAYLPSIIKILEEDPTACACIQNRRRTLEIKRNSKGIFSSILLPEGIDSTETNVVRVYPATNSKMRPYSFNNLLFVSVSMALCVLGFLLLLIVSIFALISYQKPIKTLPTTKLRNLPVQQWENLVNSYTHEIYVEKLSFENNKWRTIQRKAPLLQSQQQEKFIEDAVKQEIANIVKQEVKQEIESGIFLTDKEKDEISLQLRDNIIKTVKETKPDLINNIRENSFGDNVEEFKEIIEDDIMPPMEEYEFGYPIEDGMNSFDKDTPIIDRETSPRIPSRQNNKRTKNIEIIEPNEMPLGLTPDGMPDIDYMDSIIIE